MTDRRPLAAPSLAMSSSSKCCAGKGLLVEKPEDNAATSRPISIMGDCDSLTTQSLDIRVPGRNYVDKSIAQGPATSNVNLAVSLTVNNSGREPSTLSQDDPGLATSATDMGPFQSTGERHQTTPAYPTISLWAVLSAYLSDVVPWSTVERGRSASGHSVPDQNEAGFSVTELDNSEALPVSPNSASRTTSLSETYVRSLLWPGRGLPCWNPRPRQPELLPLGVRPGDVGTYSTDAGFKKIFNLWEDEDAIRDIESRIASDTAYEPLVRGTTTYPHELSGGAVIAPGADCSSPRPGSLDQEHVIHEFKYPSGTGGILAVLSPADLVVANDIEAMQSYIIQHAEALYKRCRFRLGTNTCLYIITGCIKTDLWALAAYERVEEGYGHNHIRLLQLSRTAAQSSDRPSSAYRWTLKPIATHAEHGDSGVEGLKNQTLFLQGFKLTFSDRFIAQMKGDSAESSRKRPKPSNGQGPREDPANESPGPPGGEGSASSRGDASGGYEANSVPGGVANLSAQMNAGVSSGTLAEELGFDRSREVRLSQFPSLHQHRAYHPCDTINEILLKSTGADFALSHDDDWRFLFLQYAHGAEGSIPSASHHGHQFDDIASHGFTAELVVPGATDDEESSDSRRDVIVRAGVACLGPTAAEPSDPSRGMSAVTGTTDSLVGDNFEENQQRPGCIKVTRSAEPPCTIGGQGIEGSTEAMADLAGRAVFVLDALDYEDIALPQVAIPPSKSQPFGKIRSLRHHSYTVDSRHSGFYKAASNTTDGQRLVAIKTIRSTTYRDHPRKEDAKKRVSRKYYIWSRLSHPNGHDLESLVVFDKPQTPSSADEFKEYVKLHQFAEMNGDFDRVHMAVGIASAFEYLDEGDVAIRGHLNSTDIVLDRDGSTGLFFPLVTSFGDPQALDREGYLSRIRETSLLLQSARDSDGPIDESSLTAPSDVYSFSVVLLELITGKGPSHQKRLLKTKEGHTPDAEHPHRLKPCIHRNPDESFAFCWPVVEDSWFPGASNGRAR